MLLIGCTQGDRSNLIDAQVTRVVSGQTVEVVLSSSATTAKVRIIGIDAPDLRQSPWGKTAQDELAKLIMGLSVQLELESDGNLELARDRYHRIHAHLWQNNSLISQQLVQAGCVLANTEYPHLYSKLLKDGQEYARLLEYGVWNPKQPLRYTPNQFRSKNQ